MKFENILLLIEKSLKFIIKREWTLLTIFYLNTYILKIILLKFTFFENYLFKKAYYYSHRNKNNILLKIKFIHFIHRHVWLLWAFDPKISHLYAYLVILLATDIIFLQEFLDLSALFFWITFYILWQLRSSQSTERFEDKYNNFNDAPILDFLKNSIFIYLTVIINVYLNK